MAGTRGDLGGRPHLTRCTRACRCPSNGHVPAALPRDECSAGLHIPFPSSNLSMAAGQSDSLRAPSRPGLPRLTDVVPLAVLARLPSAVLRILRFTGNPDSDSGCSTGCLTWSREVVHGIECSGRRNRRPGQPCRPRTPLHAGLLSHAGHITATLRRGLWRLPQWTVTIRRLPCL